VGGVDVGRLLKELEEVVGIKQKLATYGTNAMISPKILREVPFLISEN